LDNPALSREAAVCAAAGPVAATRLAANPAVTVSNASAFQRMTYPHCANRAVERRHGPLSPCARQPLRHLWTDPRLRRIWERSTFVRWRISFFRKPASTFPGYALNKPHVRHPVCRSAGLAADQGAVARRVRGDRHGSVSPAAGEIPLAVRGLDHP